MLKYNKNYINHSALKAYYYYNNYCLFAQQIQLSTNN